MAFQAGDRVHVTSQASPYRGRYGEVLTPAGQHPHQMNEVRLDGFRETTPVLFRDEELRKSNFVSPVQY